ncbi:MAG: Cysteine-rich secretory protein family [Segetibacter sp.]|nr:Cysteine-rich secretory protein family [Segetibacter sp.]
MKDWKVLFLLFFVTVFFSCTKENEVISEAAGSNSNINKDALLNLVNRYRASGCNCGPDYYPPVGSVSWNNTLELAAKEHSDDMNNNNYFSHTGKDGTSPGDRISKYNYRWSTYAENIAKGYPTEQSVMEGWIKSPGHCANIMNGRFKEMGVAKSGDYWTQEFATQR